MTFLEYLSTLKRHWLAILLLALVGGVAGYAVAETMPTIYRTEASVMVIPAKGSTTGELVQGSTYVQNLVQTYTLVASSPLVLDRVIDDLDLELETAQLAQKVQIESPLNTVIIVIGVTDSDPQAAQEIANGIAAALAEVVADLSPKSDDGSPAVRIETIAPAGLPPYPSSPNVRLLVVLGLAAGLAVGVAYAVVRALFGTRLTSTGDLQRTTEAPILGEIATADGRTPLPAVIRQSPSSRVAESMRNVVAALRYVDVERSKRVLLVTSPSESEGKTSVALGLSIALAEVGHRVLYVEADLRRPKASGYTQLDSSLGLTSVLVGDVGLADAVQQWGHPSLDLLLSGELPPNPTPLLSSPRLPALLEQARETYGYVIVDSAPILPVADSMWVAPNVDGIVVLARINRTTQESLRRALSSVEASQTPLLGVVVNDVRLAAKSGYYNQPKTSGRTPN